MNKDQYDTSEERQGELEEPPHKRRRWRTGTALPLESFLERPTNKAIKTLTSRIESAPAAQNFELLAQEMIDNGIKVDAILQSVHQKYAEAAVSKYAKSIKLSPDEAQAIIMCTDPLAVNVFRLWTLKGSQKHEKTMSLYSNFMKLLITGLHKLELTSLHMLSTTFFMPPPPEEVSTPKYGSLKLDQQYVLAAPICGNNFPEFQEGHSVFVIGQVFAYDVSRLSLARDKIKYIVDPLVFLKVIKLIEGSKVAVLKVTNPTPRFMPQVHFLNSLKCK